MLAMTSQLWPDQVVRQARLKPQQELSAFHDLPWLIRRRVPPGEPTAVSVADRCCSPPCSNCFTETALMPAECLFTRLTPLPKLDHPASTHVDAMVVTQTRAQDMDVVTGPESVVHALDATWNPCPCQVTAGLLRRHRLRPGPAS
jgi:hypothetical protein